MPWYREVKPRLNGNGYVTVWMPDHLNANANGYIYEHILIASKALGSPLPQGTEIHHVNEVGTDNRPQNLVICQDAAYHKLLHTRLTAYLASGDPKARKCQFCGKWEPISTPDMYVCKKQAYHKSCRAWSVAAKRQKQRIFRKMASLRCPERKQEAEKNLPSPPSKPPRRG